MIVRVVSLFVFFFVTNISFEPQADLGKQGFSKVGEKTMPAVVSVAVLAQVNDEEALKNRIATMVLMPRKDIFGYEILNNPRRIGTLGSGFVVDSRGYIVTNYHTVENAIKIKITFSDETIMEASLVGYDPGTDLAVLKVDTSKKLLALSWADSEKIKIGDWALAFGNAYGLGPTLTSGIVSSPARDLSDPMFGGIVDVEGKVIGVNFGIISSSGGSDGVGLAIPANIARKVTQNIIDYGRVRRAWIGLMVQGVTNEIAENLGLPKANGALIVTVTDNGPAKQAGIQSRDIILKINDKKIKDAPDVSRIIGQLAVGEKVSISLWREGKNKTIHVTLQEFQSHEDYRKTIKTSKTELKDHVESKEYEFGVTSLTWQFRQRFHAENPAINGVLVSDTQEGGWAEKNGLLVGDIILEINKTPVTSIEEFEKEIKTSIQHKKTTLFFIYRFGQKLFITLKPKPEEKKER